MNTLIRASAGSGKTYALTTQYLRILRERHRDETYTGLRAESLLAATFTRKAAGEIFDRILARLAAAALDDGALTELRTALGEEALTGTECADLLLRLCRSLHRLSIGTLDSFFQRLCALYRHETGLMHGFRLSDPRSPRCSALQREAIRVMLGKMPPERVESLHNGLTGGKASSPVVAEFLGLIAGLSETLDGAPADAWEQIAVPLCPTQDEIDAALAALRREAQEFWLASWRTALDGDLENFQRRQWDEFLGKGLSAACRKTPPKYGNSKDAIPDTVIAGYGVLYAVAAAEILGALRERTLAIRDLLGEFTAEYAVLRHAEGLVLFSETPRLLAQVAGDAMETARRLDAPVEHLLLDEFQDTSDTQWGLLQGFALPAASRHPGSVFVVGDAKQAIYGWRGGRAEIFERIESVLPRMERESRDVSFRSAQTILDAVNTVFSQLPENETLREHHVSVGRWAAYFQPHQAHRAGLGFVELCVSPLRNAQDDENEAEEAEGTENSRSHLAHCADRIAASVRGLPATASASVLVRTNKTVAQIADLLRAQGIDVSSEGAGKIADDPAVEIILSALALADHPGHTAAAYHVAHSPLAAAVGLGPGLPLEPQHTATVANAIRRRVLMVGYAGVIIEWAAILAPHGVERTARRLEQLVDLATEFDTLPPMRAAEFVRAVREASVENPGAARVRVMTINRAKGLEFDTVFLPELDWKARASGPGCLVKRAGVEAVADGKSPIEAIYGYATKAHFDLSPALAQAAEDALAEEVTGMLCLLYVAMTRARVSLHLFVPPRRINKDSKPGALGLTPAAILRNAPQWTMLFEAGALGESALETSRETVLTTTPSERPVVRFRESR